MGKVLSILEERATNGDSIDIRELSEAYAMDSLTQLQFGSTAGSHFLDDLRNWTRYSNLFHLSRRQYHFVENEVPGLLGFLNCIGISRPRRQIDEATSRLEDWNLQMCIQAENLLCRQEIIVPADYPTIYAQERRARQVHSDHSVDDCSNFHPAHACLRMIASNMLDSNIAGHEGAGDVLTFLHRELAADPSLQLELHRELRTLNPPFLHPIEKGSELAMPCAQEIDNLPLLDAILLETLRLCVPRIRLQTRVPGHRKCSLAGFDIPEDVQVQCYPYVSHRNPDVFLHPELWDPYRWIDTDPVRLERMRGVFWPFGKGERACIGKHISMHGESFLEKEYLATLTVVQP